MYVDTAGWPRTMIEKCYAFKIHCKGNIVLKNIELHYGNRITAEQCLKQYNLQKNAKPMQSYDPRLHSTTPTADSSQSDQEKTHTNC